MRLLNVKTLKLESFYDTECPEYAALSHTWNAEEVTFQDFPNGLNRQKKGWAKVLAAAVKAEKYDFEYIWIDSCCIDKTSSAELSESINSMFRWYQNCGICLVHLKGIRKEPKPLITLLEVDSDPVPPEPSNSTHPSLASARWFTRGWTLQELIAPSSIIFYDEDWVEIGDKMELLEELCAITGIESDVLRNETLLRIKSIANKMSWASSRVTTRSEDIAYCLMGLFDVNMPLLYGEGGVNAFVRLQEEIMKRNNDQSIFAWNSSTQVGAVVSNGHVGRTPDGIGVLASHPSAFLKCANIIPHSTEREPYTMTNKGLYITLQVLPTNPWSRPGADQAIIACCYRNDPVTAIGIPITNLRRTNFGHGELSLSEASRKDSSFCCRTANEDLVHLDVTNAMYANFLKSCKLYIHGNGPVWRNDVSGDYNRFYLRYYGMDRGIQFRGALYCQFSFGAVLSEAIVRSWDPNDRKIEWDRDWPGIRIALQFSSNDGSTSVVLITILNSHNGWEEGKRYICIKTGHLGTIDLEEILRAPLGKHEVSATRTNFRLDHRAMTAKLEDGTLRDVKAIFLDFHISKVAFNLKRRRP